MYLPHPLADILLDPCAAGCRFAPVSLCLVCFQFLLVRPLVVGSLAIVLAEPPPLLWPCDSPSQAKNQYPDLTPRQPGPWLVAL